MTTIIIFVTMMTPFVVLAFVVVVTRTGKDGRWLYEFNILRKILPFKFRNPTGTGGGFLTMIQLPNLVVSLRFLQVPDQSEKLLHLLLLRWGLVPNLNLIIIFAAVDISLSRSSLIFLFHIKNAGSSFSFFRSAWLSLVQFFILSPVYL